LCYIGDVKTPDFDTPKRAKVHFKRAKCQVMIQKQKIKRLNETVRRLRKKIVSIESLLNHLKKQNYITENAHDEISVSYQTMVFLICGLVCRYHPFFSIIIRLLTILFP